MPWEMRHIVGGVMSMCGRFVVTVQMKQMASRFATQGALPTDAASGTVAPTQSPAVVTAEAMQRKLEAMRWGLIPAWGAQAGRRVLLINARAETLTQKPIFNRLLLNQRCLVPASGFFEWEKLPNGCKHAIHYRLRNSELFAFAGLWDTQTDTAGNPVRAFTIITTAANEVVRPVHDRMPVMLIPEAEDAWLHPSISTTDLMALLRPYDANLMTAEDGAPQLAASKQTKQPSLPL